MTREIKKWISDGHIEIAFDELLQIQGNREDKFENTLRALQSQYNTIIKEKNLNTITNQEFNLTYNRIINALLEIVRKIENENRFVIFKSRKERTKNIIEDLDELAKKEISSDKKIWSIAFLSIFALGDSNSYFEYQKEVLKEKKVDIEKEKELFNLLEKEKKLLLQLAYMGHEIRCIISPVNSKNVSENLNDALYRTTKLLEFLKNECGDNDIEAALENKIHWAITEYPQRNVYIFRDISIYEGYKKGHEQSGYGLTSRQTFNEVISSNSRLYENYFEVLTYRNLRTDIKWLKSRATIKTNHETKEVTPAGVTREYTIFRLEESLRFLNSIARLKKSKSLPMNK